MDAEYKFPPSFREIIFSSEDGTRDRNLNQELYVFFDLTHHPHSHPMTLNDLERRDAKGQFFFWCISVIRQFDLERPKLTR